MGNAKKILNFPDLQKLKETQERNETNEIPRLNLEQVKHAVDFFCVPGCSKFAAGGYATFDVLCQLANAETKKLEQQEADIYDIERMLDLHLGLLEIVGSFAELYDYIEFNNSLEPSDKFVPTLNQAPLKIMKPTSFIYEDFPRFKKLELIPKLAERIIREEKWIQDYGKNVVRHIKDIEWWKNPENVTLSLPKTTPANPQPKEIVKTSSNILQRLRKFIPL